MDLLIVIATGSVVGFMSAFFGVGGGGLLLPVFYSAFVYMEPKVAIPISLGTIFLNTVTNSIRFYNAGIFPGRKTLISFLITCSVGALIGSILVLMLDPHLLKKGFAIMLLVIVAKILFTKPQINDQDRVLHEPPLLMGLTGFIGAFIAGITGLGGGIIYVPMFMTVVKLPFKYITSFSNVAMGIGALIAVIPYFWQNIDLARIPNYLHPYFVGSVNLLIIGILFISGFLTGKLGVRMNNSVTPEKKKIWLASILGVLALKILIF